MSGLFLPVNGHETLHRIQARLSQGVAPPLVIEELLSGSRDEAISWGRRLAGWDDYTPHSLRATAATVLLDAGEDICKVQELLGHRHVTTTQIYDKRRRQAHEGASHDIPI